MDSPCITGLNASIVPHVIVYGPLHTIVSSLVTTLTVEHSLFATADDDEAVLPVLTAGQPDWSQTVSTIPFVLPPTVIGSLFPSKSGGVWAFCTRRLSAVTNLTLSCLLL